jgi:fatty acid desaturase
MPDGTLSAPPIDRKTLAALSARSDAAGWGRLALHAAVLAGTGVLVWQLRGSPWIWPAMLVHGIVLAFLFAPLHETIHRTAFASRSVNEGVAFLLGATLLLPHEYFRAFHFEHHRFTQDPARDPELASPKPTRLRQWLWAATGLPYWIFHVRLILRQAMGRTPEGFYKSAAQRRAVVREARVLLAIYGGLAVLSLATGSLAVLILWVVPELLGQPFLRLYLMAEHSLCPLDPGDMWRNSRTTRSNALVRLLAWNMPYHGAHHAYPSVPFHALPRLDRLVAPSAKTTESGYLAVQRAILAAIRGK